MGGSQYAESAAPLLAGAPVAGVPTAQGAPAMAPAPGGGGQGGAPSAGAFEYGHRPVRDLGWALLYALFLVGVVAAGAYGASHGNPDYDVLASSESLARAATCPAEGARGAQRYGAADGFQEPETIDADHFLHSARGWLAASAAGSVIIGALFVALIAHHPRAVVRTALVVQAAIVLTYGVALVQVGGGLALVFGLLSILLGCLLVYLVFKWPSTFETCARLLAVAGAAVRENPGLSFVALGVQVVLLLVLMGHGAASVAAMRNGEPARRPDVVQSGDVCYSDGNGGGQVDCCYWRPDAWVIPAWSLIGLSMLWTTFVAFDLKLHVVAGSVAQWYYTPLGTPARGTTWRALRNATGPGFGSVTFGAAILTLCELVRQAAAQARRDARRSGDGAAQILACLCQCVLSCIAEIIEYPSKFAIIEAAITGLGFWAAGKQSTERLKRHFNKAYTVWWLPPTVLNTMVLLVAVGYGVAVGWLGTRAFAADDNDTKALERVVLGVLAGLMALIVLGFFATLVLNAADAAFACYTHDLDNSRIGRPEVHAVYAIVVPLAVGAGVANVAGAV